MSGRRRAIPRTGSALAVAAALAVACAGQPDKVTLAQLHRIEPDTTEIQVTDGLDEAMRGYRRFLEEAPKSALTPEAMRRLADLKLEKEYGILDGNPLAALPVPDASAATSTNTSVSTIPAGASSPIESEQAFEKRASAGERIGLADRDALAFPDGHDASAAGPREAIALYDEILAAYPNYEHNDRVLYQKARAYDEIGNPDQAITVIEQLIAAHPHSRHIDEVQFRRAEYFFTRRRYLDAEESYAAIAEHGPVSSFYELALYKLGWTLYKQELHEQAVDQYIALLDYKVGTGYDFDQSDDADGGRRIADTFRVVSLSFSSIGGPETVGAYFANNGQRVYEDRIYRHLGEFFLEKLRYQDAASAYEAFVALHPQHRSAPHFGMRVVEIYEAGGFPKLVLSSKKDFAARYGLGADFWQKFPIEEAPEIVAYLKANLRDLANHYHAAYQDAEQADIVTASFDEAHHWYEAFLTSFPEDAEAPAIHHKFADLLLEHEDFGDAAREYERTAYDYPANPKAADAGYAAIYAHRQNYERAKSEGDGANPGIVREAAVASTLRFVDRFPEHVHAPVVLGAAIDDLFEMKRYDGAIANGRRLLETYPDAEQAIRRSAWLVIAHSAFGIDDYPQAEQAYSQVLGLTAPTDDSRQAVLDNLAASIYKQGERANAADDHAAAAAHFLRIAQAAPDSAIRPAADYDAGAALMLLQDWGQAIAVFNAFRDTHPQHELHREATKQLASIYREQNDLENAAVEYERIAAESETEELHREALLVAGELYEEAGVPSRAIGVYLGYLERYPKPLELAVETRFKVATLYGAANAVRSQHEQLREIVDIDRNAGTQRTDRIRYLAARSALVLTEGTYDRFAEVKLVQPFDKSLQKKQRLMDEALSAFTKLVDYQVAEVTAAATFYMAQIYRELSDSLLTSERPSDVDPAQRADYDLALEEEAFPFEDKAIEIHKKNLELMDAGIYNRWIEKSLAALGELMPGRYAKFEESAGLIASIDRYAYQAPQMLTATPPLELEATAQEAQPSEAVDPEPSPPAAPSEASEPEPEAVETLDRAES